ncbi:ABC transporter permease [Pontibacter burrus]|uniref:ABC transporter permease n=1 Tax=Pontibacter burrus TaxID=2704466 RepID=A0A6B3LKJ7_9BACT|nr:ABC transporter permease [Pontibacter burrus]NEM97452.1 ABC transporter permease [Pontibacter burrus]
MRASLLVKKFLSALVLVWLMLSAVFMLSRMLPGTFGEEKMLQSQEGFYSQSNHTSRAAAYNELLKRTRQDLPVFYFSLAPINLQHNTGYSYLVPDPEWHGLHNQYHFWLNDLLQGNLGTSFVNAKPVTIVIREAGTTTLVISFVSLALTIAIALGAGIWMVQDTGKKLRKPLLATLVVLDSMPLFVFSLLLLLLLANPDAWQVFPVFGLGISLPGSEHIWLSQAPYLILPVFCLTLNNVPYLTNQFYNYLSGTLQAGYIRTARAKGLPSGQVVTKHALKNALLPVITVLSDMLPALVAGTVVIETIFAIPGLGRLLVSSVLARDFPVIIGVMVLVAIVKMFSNILADIAYATTDPRIGRRAA